MKPIELYTTAGCPYSEAAREDLEWRGVDFIEYDVREGRGSPRANARTHRRHQDGPRYLRGRQARPDRLDGQRMRRVTPHPDNHRATSGAW